MSDEETNVRYQAGMAEATASFTAAQTYGPCQTLADFQSIFQEILLSLASTRSNIVALASIERLRAANAIAQLSAQNPLKSGLSMDDLILGNNAALMVIGADGKILSLSGRARDVLDRGIGSPVMSAGEVERARASLAMGQSAIANIPDADGRPHIAELGSATGGLSRTAITAHLGRLQLSPSLRAKLGQLYDLSRAELDVMELTLKRHQITRIAERRARSIDTIRTQHNKIIRKFSAASIMDAAMSIAEATPRTNIPVASLHDIRPIANAEYAARYVTLKRGGVETTYFKAGPANATALFYVHPVEFPAPPSESFVRAAIRRGLRVIAPMRGAVTGAACRYETTADEAQELNELARQLGVDNGILVAAGSGAGLADTMFKMANPFAARATIANAAAKSSMMSGMKVLSQSPPHATQSPLGISSLKLWLCASTTSQVYQGLWDTGKTQGGLHNDAHAATKFAIATILNADDFSLDAQIARDARHPSASELPFIDKNGTALSQIHTIFRPATLFDAPGDLIGEISTRLSR